jgi:hypothetical protein
MKKAFTQVNEITIIEQRLLTGKIGILAFLDLKSRVEQTILPYLYYNKNIYVSFDPKEETPDKINIEEPVNFSIVKEKIEFGTTFQTLHITCYGRLKKIDDQKLIEEIGARMDEKYTLTEGNGQYKYSGEKIYFIDTEELQAMSLAGGSI